MLKITKFYCKTRKQNKIDFNQLLAAQYDYKPFLDKKFYFQKQTMIKFKVILNNQTKVSSKLDVKQQKSQFY